MGHLLRHLVLDGLLRILFFGLLLLTLLKLSDLLLYQFLDIRLLVRLALANWLEGRLVLFAYIVRHQQ